jgi:segregation and condensation protein B
VTGAQSRDLAAALEALLFVADRPLSTTELAELAEVPAPAVSDALDELRAGLADRGIRLQELDGAWQLTTAPEVADRVRRYAERTEGRLSPAAVEALAVIAYRQPATRGDIERVRGVDSDSVIRSLLHRRLIAEAGRRDTPGRPILYRTTFTFLERFGMESLEALPALELDGPGSEHVAEPAAAAEVEAATDPGAEPAGVTNPHGG